MARTDARVRVDQWRRLHGGRILHKIESLRSQPDIPGTSIPRTWIVKLRCGVQALDVNFHGIELDRPKCEKCNRMRRGEGR